MKRIFALSPLLLVFLFPVMTWAVGAISTDCPGSAFDPGAKLSIYLTCNDAETGPDCQSFPGPENTEMRLKTSTRMSFKIEKAEIVQEDHGEFYTAIQLDPAGVCWFRKATEENIGKALSIVIDGKVLLAPVIRSAIPDGRIQITMGYTTTEPEVVAFCRTLDPTCQPPDGALVKFLKKVSDWIWSTKNYDK